jgi:hypothetical protein
VTMMCLLDAKNIVGIACEFDRVILCLYLCVIGIFVPSVLLMSLTSV